jgi:alkaline phosphatase
LAGPLLPTRIFRGQVPGWTGGIKVKGQLRNLAWSLLLILLLSFSIGWAGEDVSARSAIFFIGDGMGPQIVSIVKIYAERSLERELNMVRLANTGATGFMTTHSDNSLVTDSAASGTAMATGHKTDNGVVGMTPDGDPVANLFEEAVRVGKSVGVVTTTSITDATPAVFLAHATSRRMYFDIATQIVDSNAMVVMGGGWRFFLPPERGRRQDGTDLTEEARLEGFDVVFDRDAMMAADGARLLGLFAGEELPYERVRNKNKIPSLAEMTAKALEVLSGDPDGFLLVVEGGRIDHAEHENSISDAVMDFLAFDDAIGEGVKYQATDSTVTIVVSADHDCGGPAITAAGYGYPSHGQVDKIADEGCRFIRWVSGDHKVTMVPVFARGPGADRFSGIMDNTELHGDLADLLGL